MRVAEHLNTGRSSEMQTCQSAGQSSVFLKCLIEYGLVIYVGLTCQLWKESRPTYQQLAIIRSLPQLRLLGIQFQPYTTGGHVSKGLPNVVFFKMGSRLYVTYMYIHEAYYEVSVLQKTVF